MAIKSIEWLGFFEATAVCVKSNWMKEEVIRIYNVPKEKITVISTDPILFPKEALELYSRVAEAKKNET
jgi:hypothetical protein